MYQDNQEQFAGRSVAQEQGFVQLALRAANASVQLAKAVQTGSRVLVLSGSDGTERRSVLASFNRTVESDGFQVKRIDGACDEGVLTKLLSSKADQHDDGQIAPGLQSDPSKHRELGLAGQLIVIDNADLLPLASLSRLHALMHNEADDVRLLVSGGAILIPRLCTPDCRPLWQSTALVVQLDPPAGEERHSNILVERLQAEIARTEAKLATQRRMLRIFTDTGSFEDSGIG
ncbi:hypothetical protein RM533_12045 [Croceicoccus sp. F390]|uniref:Chromosomal replication initiator protein DnaA domain-containing protein n=1 Tax=Croceicoccus esteveae TaxID=3075597 RepID=A0ABU2ZKK0_9SPHN|nr:hypothetical protein [Croceicoccus sp. F390]MDT0576901.1 hypothetical protein [Croceicoccus sp. F390]